MSRKDRETTIEKAYEAFDQSPYATLSMIDEDNKPYAVMISPIRSEDTIYFHCGITGKKLDCLKLHPDVCLSAVSTMQVVPEKYSVDYVSCILQGQASIVEDLTEKKDALYQICEKYSGAYMQGVNERIQRSLSGVCIVKIRIDKLTGKENNLL